MKNLAGTVLGIIAIGITFYGVAIITGIFITIVMSTMEYFK